MPGAENAGAIAGPPLTAADIMTPAPRTCSNFSTVLEVVMVMRDEDCGAVPVLEDGKPVGIVTDRDIALALSEFQDLAARPVTDVMSKGVIAVKPTAPLREVHDQLSGRAVRRLLVIDAEDNLVGIISWADLAPNLTDVSMGRIVSEVVEQPS